MTKAAVRKVGRPVVVKAGKRRNIYIDEASWAAAEKLGAAAGNEKGSASEGIRIAIERATSG